ncbi:hypothetical protein ACFL6P_07080 [Candidatus Latescibacterota bacterium]
MNKISHVFIPVFLFFIISASSVLNAQSIYDLRKLTDQDWAGMTTEERLSSLNIANNTAENQTFLGSFNSFGDLNQRWGYDYYEQEDKYENYAFRGFENYNIVNDRRNQWYYNQFGDKITKMRRSATLWREEYGDDGTLEIEKVTDDGDFINTSNGVNADGVWVARESTDDWAASIVTARSLRVKYTPLTLSVPGIAGTAVDFQSANFEARFMSSVLSGAQAHFYHTQANPTQNTALWMLRGGQLRRKFGALTLGTTYVNMYTMQGARDGGSSFEGHVTNYQPTPIRYAVRILDDSPQDGDGPTINDVKLIINGQVRSDIIPFILKDDIRREQQTAIYSRTQQVYLYPESFVESETDRLKMVDRMPKHLDYLYLQDYMNGWNSENVRKNFDIDKAQEYYEVIEPGGKQYQVNGYEYAVYLFDLSSIPDKIKDVRAEITVAGDYKVQTAKIYTDIVGGRQDPDGGSYQNYYNATFWDTKAQADGNVKDGSNLRTLQVDFGYEVANIIYGMDAHFNYLGFKFDGEYVVNRHNYMFSDGYAGSGITTQATQDLTPRDGKRYSFSDDAYYMVVQKEWKKFAFVGEYFKMGKFYRPHMNYVNPKVVVGQRTNARNGVESYSLIPDNDDNDQYADAMFYKQGMGVYIFTHNDPDGVHPGNDLDRDSLPDTDKNFNGIGDYNEPFLMLDVDPNEFVFGDDMNNNTIPDFREDDFKDDTPYDLDRRGHHLYMRVSPQQNIDMVFGTMKQRGIGLDTRNDDNYFKLRFNYSLTSVGRLFAEYRYNRVKDNIQDSYIIHPDRPKSLISTYGQASRYYNDIYFDETEYRNSSVNKLFFETIMRPINSVTAESHVKFERNFRIEGTAYDNVYQPEDIINTLAVSNKIVYTKQLGSFSISPGLKYRLYKKGYRESLNPRKHYTMQIPVLFLKYRVSARTNVTLGFQGIKGFETKFTDIIQTQNNYKQKNITLQIDNRTDYFGFQVWGGFGFQIEEFQFEEVYRGFENYKTSSIFVRMWLSFE